jgi:hypothetical protein
VGEGGQEEDELPPDYHCLFIGWEKGWTREIVKSKEAEGGKIVEEGAEKRERS